MCKSEYVKTHIAQQINSNKKNSVLFIIFDVNNLCCNAIVVKGAHAHSSYLSI